MEIYQTLRSMLEKTAKSQCMNISQQNKDMIRNVMNQSLDMVLEQTSPRKINQIVVNEFRKNRQEDNS